MFLPLLCWICPMIQNNNTQVNSAKNFLHHMLCNYVDGNFEKSIFYRRLVESTINTSPDIYKQLDKYDKYRYRTMCNSLNTGDYTNKLSKFFVNEESQRALSNDESNDISINEKKLVRMIIKNEVLLRKVIKKDLRLACTELKTPYGYVDLVGYTKEYAVPIEVKLKTANHSIIGQILKYMKYFVYRLNYGLYRDVVGVLIAKGYTEDVLQECKKINVVPLTYNLSENSFSIQKA